MTHSDNQTAFWGQFLHDPVKFFGTFWPCEPFTKPQYPLAPYQVEVLRSVATNTETWVHSAHEMGKCLGRDTPVMMFDGSVKMCQDVRVGDLLMGDDNTPRRVLSTTQGYGPLFKVRPKARWHDRRRRVAPYLNEYVVNADHILSLQWSGKKQGFATKDISVSDWLSGINEHRVRLSGYRAPVDFQEKTVRIDPYFLGVWLGDGHSYTPAITTADKEIVDVVNQEAAKRGMDVIVRSKQNNKASIYFIRRRTAKHRNSLLDELRSYGVACKVTQPSLKHVPDEYKINSRRVRSEVLAGLLDTDGESYPTGYRFSNKSHRLACDVVWLARSLGLGADISECTKKSQNGTVGTYYRVIIRGNGLPCRLHRKRPSHDSVNAPHRYGIIRVDPIGDGEYFGFAVDGNHRFLLGDFTVTHNSFTASIAALWWFCTRPSKVIVISASESQLRTAMWGEINKLMRLATYQGKPFSFGLVKRDLKLLYPSDSELPDPEHFLWLRPVKEGESIHGAHMPTLQLQGGGEAGTVLWIFEEGSSIPKEFFDIAATSRHSMLVVGNPTRDDGEYAKVCKAGPQRHPLVSRKLFRKVIHISGEDSPNVKIGIEAANRGIKYDAIPKVNSKGMPMFIPGILSYPTYLERLETYSEYEKRTRLFGLFPEEEGQKLFTQTVVQTAQRLGEMLRQRMQERKRPVGAPFALGVDSSEGGGDKSSFYVWGRFGVVYSLTKETPNTTDVSGTAIALMRKYKIKPWFVAFDSGGGGKEHADTLRDRGYEEVADVRFGSNPDDAQKYMNKRAELYGMLREAMQVSWNDDRTQIVGRIGRMLKGTKVWGHRKAWCVSIPPDAATLVEDLTVLPLLRDAEGRLRMLPKDRKPGKQKSGTEKCLRDLLGRSPDQGDACALAHYAWVRGREYDAAASIDGPLVWG